MKTFRQIIDLWASHQDLRRDLAAQGIVLNKMSVTKWVTRDYIPPNHWPAVLSSAASRGLAVSEADLIGAMKITVARRAREREERQKRADPDPKTSRSVETADSS